MHTRRRKLNAKMAEYIKKESESLQKVSKTNTALQEDKPTLLDEDDEREKLFDDDPIICAGGPE